MTTNKSKTDDAKNNQQIYLQEAIDRGNIKYISYETFNNIKIISSGAHGSVSRAYWSTGERNIVLKSLDNEYDAGDAHFYQELVKEVRKEK